MTAGATPFLRRGNILFMLEKRNTDKYLFSSLRVIGRFISSYALTFTKVFLRKSGSFFIKGINRCDVSQTNLFAAALIIIFRRSKTILFRRRVHRLIYTVTPNVSPSPPLLARQHLEACARFDSYISYA